MQGSSKGRRRRGFRRGFRRDSRGVVSVVGTLLSLLVFFALFGVFLTSYVPLWMSENEESLTTQIQTALAQLKAGIDGQVTTAGPSVVGTPFPVASGSIPLIAQPTVASIRFTPPGSPAGPYANFTMSPAPGGPNGSSLNQSVSVGNLFVNVPSRYYSPTSFSLENDAVIQSQGPSQQIVEFPPTLVLNPIGSGFGLTATLVVVTGISSQAASSGTQEIFTHLLHSQTFTTNSTGSNANATLVEGTLYPCAWSAFVNSSIPPGFPTSDYNFTHLVGCGSTLSSPDPLTVTFTNLLSVTLIFAQVQIVIGIGTG